MTERTYWRIQCVAVAVVAALFALPHVRHAVWTQHRGLLRIVSTDDGFYQARVRAALLWRFNEVRNGMTGGSEPARGISPALLETAAGVLFSWTSLKAPQVMLLLTVFVTPFILMLLAALLRTLFGGPLLALWGSGLYTLVFLGALQKPINMSLSLPLAVTALLLLAKLWDSPRPWKTLTVGLLLGVLPSTYFWGWTFVWAVTGWLLFLAICVPRLHRKRQRITALFGACVIGLLLASPAFLELLTAGHGSPHFAATAVRSTVVYSRGIESVPRFVLSTALLVSALLLGRRHLAVGKLHATSLFALAAVLGMYTAMYQNFVHGVILTFSSHYYPYVCLAALIVGLWALAEGGHTVRRAPLRWAVVSLASVFLLAGLYDYRSAWNIVRGTYYVRDLQHLRPAVNALDDNFREIVLTDRSSAHMVTTWTDDDVIFTAYARHLLISDEEYAQRYCLTELFNPAGPDIDWLAHEVVERPSGEDYAQRREQFAAICDPIRASPGNYLKKYGVSKLLWNERLRPEWRIDQRRFARVQRGDGWSVWAER